MKLAGTKSTSQRGKKKTRRKQETPGGEEKV